MFEELKGNSSDYDLDKVKPIKNSPLKGLSFLFLGSSVTIGFKSCEVSFPEYLSKRNGFEYVKEAVSGTTLTDGNESYIERLRKLKTAKSFDFLVCQLSTNDAYCQRNFGTISESFSIEDFDTSTIYGAIEYIISYAKTRLNARVVFYTSPYYENEHYKKMVQGLLAIQKKWKIGVIDMYSDPYFNKLDIEKKELYMADPIHPTKAGYLEWITPYMEKHLYQMI